MSTRPLAHRNGTANVRLRVLPIPLALGIISIIDRTNIGYASLQMNEAIGRSATAFGFGAGVLFLGYFALEIPSNLALKHFGARKWLARIAISWGVAMRFLLGLAEAGLFPGVILYLTSWFPKEERGRAVAIFMACIPISTIVGARSPAGYSARADSSDSRDGS